MKIIGHMVVRNELHRYLTASYAALRDQVDSLVVFDDWSDDGTYEWLREHGATVVRRAQTTSSLLQDESHFRERAWRHMESLGRPQRDDWIVLLDADEFLVTGDGASLRDILKQIRDHDKAVHVRIDEIFRVDPDGQLQVRTDRLWGQTRGCRVVRWRPGGHFARRKQGGGSIPRGWDWPHVTTDQLRILHLGYARPEDRQDKHQRYTEHPGHNPAHVHSILEPPTLRPYHGDVPVALLELMEPKL